MEHTVPGEGIAKVGSRCWLRVGGAGKHLTAQERLDEATKQVHQGTKCIKGLNEAKTRSRCFVSSAGKSSSLLLRKSSMLDSPTNDVDTKY